MKKYLELMQQIDLIKSIYQEIELDLIEGKCKTTEYGKNSIVHFVGEVCSKLEIILSGKVAIERIDESGNLMTIAEFFSGDILGGNLMFSKNPHYPMTVTAKQLTLILEMDKNQLLRLLADNHDFLRNYRFNPLILESIPLILLITQNFKKTTKIFFHPTSIWIVSSKVGLAFKTKPQAFVVQVLAPDGWR